MGCNPIILLGIDYDKNDRHIVPQTATLASDADWIMSRDNFSLFCPMTTPPGSISILNANLDSAVECFPKTTVQEIIDGCRNYVPDVET